MRLGLLIPSSNVVLEPLAAQLQARRPEISVHVSRLGVLDVKLNAASRAQFEMETKIAAAKLLCDANVDHIIWGGTSASWLGITHDEVFASRIEQETGIPATTCVLEINRHLAVLGAKRLGMVTPYTDDVSAQIDQNYAEMGFEVIASRHNGGDMSNDFAAIQPTVIERMIRDVAAAKPEAVIVMCTNVAAAALATELTADLGIPVLDSAAITLGLD